MQTHRHPILVSVTCLGVSALVTQVLILREFLTVFAGNELILGLVLGSWLLLTGLGALIGRLSPRLSNPLSVLIAAQVGIAFLPLTQIALVRLTKQFFLPGLTPGLGAAFLTALLVLLPYCLLAGFALVLCTGLISAPRPSSAIGQVYALDTLGSIAGGLLFSALLVFLFTPTQTAAFLLVVNLSAALLLARGTRRNLLSAALVGLLLIALIALRLVDLERLTGRALFPGLDLVYQQSTPYGHLAVVRQGNQLTAFENGQPLGATDDRLAAEEMVHYALSQHAAPERVLLISGGLQGAVAEVGKYPSVTRIDYVELDPALIALAEKTGALGSDPRLRAIPADARRFVKISREIYDAVLVDLPPPATAQLNRFYTVEFFSEVKQILAPDGVFSFGISGAANYAGEHVRLLASSIHRSLEAVFPSVLAIPGERIWLVASARPLDYDIAARLEERGIETHYVRADYLEARLAPDRIDGVRDMVTAAAPLNRDFAPTSYYAHLRHWLGRFGGGLLLPFLFLLGVGLLLAVLFFSTPQRPVAFAVGASGFAGMGLEVLLLLTFQVIYGHVYQHLGLIVTAFLGGAAGGAAWANRSSGDARTLLLRLDGALALVPFALVPLLLAIRSAEAVLLHTFLPPLLFALLTGVVGFLVGAQLPAAARLTFRSVEETAGSLFALDLLGGAAGGLLIAAFCVPLLGLENTCYLLGGLKLLSAAYLFRWQPTAAGEFRIPVPGRMLVFGGVLFAFIALGTLIIAPDTSATIYAFTFTPAYHWLLLGLVAWGLSQAMDVRIRSQSELQKKLREISRRIYQRTRLHPLRWLFFLAFAPVAFYPIFRCYFKVPYLFCHACPRLCIFGYMRPYLVPAALLMNLEKRHWCHHACPLGTLYHCQAISGGRGRRLAKWLFVLPLIILAFTAVGYFELPLDLDQSGFLPGDWHAFFIRETFAVSGVVILIAALFLLLGYRWRRSFCDTLCPVGTFSELFLKIERKLSPRSAPTRKEVPDATPAS